MKIPPELARFVEGPVLMTLATRDARNRPTIARSAGGRFPDPSGRLEVAISAHLWPETVANLRDNGALSVTVVDPARYVAFQLKGRATLRAADRVDRDRGEAYVLRTENLLADLGVDRSAIRYWLTARDLVVASLEVESIFEQTPGPRAGAVVA